MSVNYKLGADAGAFKQGMQEAQASLKTLDAALKANEASLKAGGNAQLFMEQRTKLLNDKMQQQKKMAEQLQDAMKKMAENGVSKTSVEYQKLHQQLLQAQAGMNETSYAMDHLTKSEQEAATGADKLTSSVNSIGKKISLEQVISGIGFITGALETAAAKAVQLGANIWDDIMNTARLSDDYATMAVRYGIDVETLQQQIKVFDTMADTSIEAYYKARMKIAAAIKKPNDEQIGILEMLGLVQRTPGKFGEIEDINILVKDSEDALWEVGQRLRQKVKSGELTQDDANLAFQAMFGRSFQEINPLLDMGKEGFEAAVDAQSAATEKAIENNAALADSVALLQSNFETFKIEVLGGLSPELTKITDSISSMVNSFTEYAQSEAGQELLKSLGESVEALFKDLTALDPEKAIEGLTGVFEGLRSCFVWLTENKQGVIDALKGIVAGWAGLKLTGGVLQVWQLISGLQGFVGAGGAAGSNLGAVGSAAGLGGKAGGGLNFVSKMLTGGTGAAAGVVTVATNGAAVGDYLVNNTRIGQEIRDTGDVIGSAEKVWNEKLTEIKQNAKTFVQDWGNVVQQIWEASYYDEYFQSVGTTANLIKNGANDLSNWIGDIIGNSVTDFVMDTIKDVANAPEAVKQVTNSTPEQNRNAFRTIIDTFLNGMQEGGGGSHGFGVPVEPVLEDDAQETLQEQASKLMVQVGARIVPVSFSGGAGGGGGGKFGYLAFHANGI